MSQNGDIGLHYESE